MNHVLYRVGRLSVKLIFLARGNCSIFTVRDFPQKPPSYASIPEGLYISSGKSRKTIDRKRVNVMIQERRVYVVGIEPLGLGLR